MITIVSTLAFIAVIALSAGSTNMNATVVRVYDGDTIFVNINNCPDIFCKNIGIRLAGIDTPELKGKCEKEKALALEAKAFVEQLLPAGSNVTLMNAQRGKYFRVVTEVYRMNGQSISELLIKYGFAVYYDGQKKTKDWCK